MLPGKARREPVPNRLRKRAMEKGHNSGFLGTYQDTSQAVDKALHGKAFADADGDIEKTRRKGSQGNKKRG